MTLRLYQITDTKTGKPVPATYFGDKKLAKRTRAELNKENSEDCAGTNLRFVVSPGPDHRKYKG